MTAPFGEKPSVRKTVEVDLTATMAAKPLDLAAELGAIPRSIVFQSVPNVGLSVLIGDYLLPIREGDIFLAANLSNISLTTTATSFSKLVMLVSSDDKPMYISPFTRPGRYFTAPPLLSNGDWSYVGLDPWARQVMVVGAYESTALDRAVRTASGQGSAINVPQFRQLTFILVIAAVSGTNPTLDIDIQYKNEDTGNWVKQSSYPQQTAVLAEELGLVIPCIASNYRVLWTIGGTTPSFNFGLALHAKG